MTPTYVRGLTGGLLMINGLLCSLMLNSVTYSILSRIIVHFCLLWIVKTSKVVIKDFASRPGELLKILVKVKLNGFGKRVVALCLIS